MDAKTILTAEALLAAARTLTPLQAVPPDPRQQEVELLRKLGDLAAQSGDVAKAREMYEEALKITRTLSAVPASSTIEPSTP